VTSDTTTFVKILWQWLQVHMWTFIFETLRMVRVQ